jgi:CBS domain-containing protein
MEAKDVMTTPVVTVRPETPVEEVAKLMLERRISAVPVVDRGGRVKGIVSEGDLLRRPEMKTERARSWWLALVASPDEAPAAYAKSHGRTAADVMTTEVVTVSERTPLERIATLLERHRIKRVPVVRGAKLVGIVSRANLLHGLAARKPGPAPAASDRTVQARVMEEMRRANVDPTLVSVVVSKGVVHLWGAVVSQEQKRAARVAAENAKGAKSVVDNVTVLSPMARAGLGGL